MLQNMLQNKGVLDVHSSKDAKRMDQVGDYNNNAMLLLTVASVQCSFVAEDEEFSKTLQRKETEMKILHG